MVGVFEEADVTHDLAADGAALLGPRELAERLGFSRRTIRRWTSAGWLPYVGPRHRPRYLWPEVVAALRSPLTG